MSDPRRSSLSKTTQVPDSEEAPGRTTPELLAFVIAWCGHERSRIGEVAIAPAAGTAAVLGRGDEESPKEPRLKFFQQRPGGFEKRPPLSSPGMSRRQLLLERAGSELRIERVGRCRLEVNGQRCENATVRPGDVVHLRRELLLYCVRRPALMPVMRLFPADRIGPFGAPDALGVIGESPVVWRLREQIAFAAKANTHVLLLGESGTGKELAARAVHALSTRSGRAFVARNAATLPAGLMDAELFGNARNYPNPGMPERAGLIGEADGGTLFLDEIGELPSELQAHLLRVLDADGDYQRLGDATPRRSRFLLVAATNRDPSSLKHDFAARLTAQVSLPSLDARREDIPLLVEHLLLRAKQRSPEIVDRFLFLDNGRPRARVSPFLVDYLLRRPYTTNIREIDALLWRAMSESFEDTVELPLALADSGRESNPPSQPTSREEVMQLAEKLAEKLAGPPKPEPTADAIRAALAENAGSVAAAARALGLSSRYALYRLMKKHGIEGAEGDG